VLFVNLTGAAFDTSLVLVTKDEEYS